MSTKQSQREKRLRERRIREDIQSNTSMTTDEEKQNGEETQKDAESDKTPRKKSLEKGEKEDIASDNLIEEISSSEIHQTEKESESIVETVDEPEKEDANEVKKLKESESEKNIDEKEIKENKSENNSDEANIKESESRSKTVAEPKSKDVKDNEVNSVEAPLKEAWQYNLETPAQCLHALISTSKLSDLTIIVKDDEPYKVHRLILSMRSPYWEKKLYKEKFDGDTMILTEEQALPFKHVLTYMYTGKTKFPDVQVAMSVYQLAHKYQMGNLMDICSQFLMSFISTSNVPEVFKCATLLGDTQLLYKCIQVMEVSPDAVFTAPTFTSMCRVSVAQLIEQELTVSSEVIVFEALLRWGRSKLESNKEEITSENLRSELLDFLPKVRFLTMTLEEFVKHVMPSGVLSLEEMREIQLNIVNASSDLPSICNPKREKRKNTSDNVPSKKAKDMRNGSPGLSHINSLTNNSSKQVCVQQTNSQASTSQVSTSKSCNPVTEQVSRQSTSAEQVSRQSTSTEQVSRQSTSAEQVSRLSGQAFVQQIPNRGQQTVVTTCQQSQANMGNNVVGAMASRIQQVQQTWTPGGGLTTVSQSASMMRAAPQGAAAFVGLVRTPLGPRLYTMPHHSNFQR